MKRFRALGIIITLIWGATWINHVFDIPKWVQTPLGLTYIIICIALFLLQIHDLCDYLDRRR